MRISRQAQSLELPAEFLLIACTNPCPCGLEARGVPVQRLAAGAVPAPAVRAPARPLRPPPARRRAAARRRPGRVRPRSSRRACSPRSSDNGPGCAARRGGGTPTCPAGALGSLRRPRPTRSPTRGASWSRSTTSPGAARPGSGGSPAPSPISTTRPTSPPSTSCWPRRCAERCRDDRRTRSPTSIAAATLAALPRMTPRAAAAAAHALADAGRGAARRCAPGGAAAALDPDEPRTRRARA